MQYQENTEQQLPLLKEAYASSYRIVKEPSFIPTERLNGSAKAARYVRNMYTVCGEPIGVYESMYLVCLDRDLNATGFAKIGQGGLAAVVTDIRLAAKYAIDCLASSVILVHNHPSGALRASQEDLNITKQFGQGFELLSIKLQDHIILTEDSYLSFSDEGITW
jgi:DNA repair protein RadC